MPKSEQTSNPDQLPADTGLRIEISDDGNEPATIIPNSKELAPAIEAKNEIKPESLKPSRGERMAAALDKIKQRIPDREALAKTKNGAIETSTNGLARLKEGAAEASGIIVEKLKKNKQRRGDRQRRFGKLHRKNRRRSRC